MPTNRSVCCELFSLFAASITDVAELLRTSLAGSATELAVLVFAGEPGEDAPTAATAVPTGIAAVDGCIMAEAGANAP